MLNELKRKVETNDSWGSRRRVIEALVADIEIETHAKTVEMRGRGRTLTLRENYRFETPALKELTPQVGVPYSGRPGHTAPVVMGLSILRTHADLNFALDQFAGARAILLANPQMMAKHINARVLRETGQTISKARVSRLKSGMKKEKEKQVSYGGRLNLNGAFQVRRVGILTGRGHHVSKRHYL